MIVYNEQNNRTLSDILRIITGTLITISCVLSNLAILLSYGWMRYAIASDRGGVNYNFYRYMGLGKEEILIHYDLILLVTFPLFIIQILALKKQKTSFYIISLFLFSIFLFGIYQYELYLCSIANSTPKG